MKKISFLSLLLGFLFANVFSQNETIITIDNQPISKSEFERIYHKNNNIEGYENKPPAEYLDMFINFKLKVLEAKKLGYDTLDAFINELAGYREQLSRPYLQDRNLIDHLVQEAYYRTVNEVNASHIMVRLPSSATPEDTLKAYYKALDIRKRLMDGASFDKIAREESDDPSGKVNNGLLGWFSAFTMVYPFENGAFNTKVGEYSMPVKSRYGYHIIRVNAFRKSPGEVKLAHIMVRSGREEDQKTAGSKKEKIEACYRTLQSGGSFAEMVKQYSEDAGTVRNSGQMRWLRSGELPAEIEDAVFNLTDSGSYTQPIRSDYGWHIFQLQGKRAVAPFEQLKSQLEEKVMMDERGKRTEEVFVSALKKDHHFTSYPENISMLASIMDSTVYSGSMNTAVAEDLIEPVFVIGDKEYSQKELVNFIAKTKRFNKKESYSDIINRKLNEMVMDELMKYEKQQLETKYPAFKYLMEEYHDGILLFNIMDDKVWSKAVQDTAGLKEFYMLHASEYNWGERADVSVYTLNDLLLEKSAKKMAKKRIRIRSTPAEFAALLCPSDSVPCVEVSDELYEKGDELPMHGFEWKKGFIKTAEEKGKLKILVVNGLLPPERKTFSETQGQVTADYQNFLDDQWIAALRAKYQVTVNREVLETIK